MPRRKKLSPSQKAINWLEAHRKTMWLLAIILLLAIYMLVHAYRGWADTRRLHAARKAIDTVYVNVSKHLGQPDNVKSLSSCDPFAGLGQNYILCNIETDFTYGAANETQANIFVAQVQKVIKTSPGFKSTKKLSGGLADTSVNGAPTHQAIDFYRGPYGANCTARYIFATPDDTTLSINNPGLLPFEVFFGCTHRSVRMVYPSDLST